MSTETDIHVRDSIEAAADAVGSLWPLHSFVTANPLAGFEDHPFHEAVAAGERLRGGDGYPSAAVFRSAWESGQIDPEFLETELAERGYRGEPETLLDRMAADESADLDAEDDEETPADHVDRVLTKWLAAFLDQGKAHWSMPGREQGFYTAFRRVARHDSRIPDAERLAELPDDPIDAVETLLDDYPTAEWQTVFEYQLSALPGWTGFLNQRIDADDDWQAKNPVTLPGYLAVRLAVADLFDAPILPPADESLATDESGEKEVPLAEAWLSAWEATYRDELVGAVEDASASVEDEEEDDTRPDAQFVFCIDTRSEVIRRHIEATGDYDTHGYAGFFGVPMRHSAYDSDVTVDACPPIVDAAHRIADRPTGDHEETRHSHDRTTGLLAAGRETLESLKGNAATAFSLVETAGAGYGVALAARTLVPDRVSDFLDAADDRVPAEREFTEPSVDYNPDSVNELREGLTLDEQVEYAESAFDLMGWEQFARVVVFAGHASQTANNPFGSSLDCGACAGNPGGPNARVLATICNDDAVQAELRERGHDIPDDTVFVAGEHNTTTDEVELFAERAPETHADDLDQLRSDLEAAQAGAAAERVGGDAENAVREATRRAADWAETRPEWGLAGNAGFVVGPRSLTDDLDLDGRAFLHSYDWQTDPEGDALEAIVTGPLVVTQWINNQYYFATVDNAAYGSGSKVTHNPVGNVGVYQGNGGDLMTGLPLQSLMSADDDPYHQPLRLSAVLHAPVDRVTEILADHPEVAGLLDNGWLSLTVVDPTQEHRGFHYEGELEWTPAASESVAEPTVPTPEPSAPIAADD